jgi:hypothetical protein
MVVKHSELVKLVNSFSMPAKKSDKIKGKGEAAKEQQIRAYAARNMSIEQILLNVFNIPLPADLEAMAKREEISKPEASHSVAAELPSVVYAKRKKAALQFINRALKTDDGE